MFLRARAGWALASAIVVFGLIGFAGGGMIVP